MGTIMTRETTRVLLSVEGLIEPERIALKVLNASLNGLYIYDMKLGHNVFINTQYTTLTGYTFEELQAMDKAQFFALFHPGDRQRVADHMERLVLNSDDMLEIEYRFKTKDGRWIWCLSRDSVFARDEDGSVSQFIGTFLDITERKRTEEALRKARDELEIKVKERTAELQQAIKRLKEENQERIRTEQSFRLEEARLDALLHLSQLSEASLKEISSFTLEQAIALTHSKIGFVGFLSEDESVYTLHAVSKDIVKECNITGDSLQWHVVDAGIWADAIREHKTLFVNDYSKPHPGKKGLPPGHPYVERFMVVPVFERGKTVAVAGVGNKTSDYDASDERQVALLLSGMWGYVQKNRSREELRQAYNELEEKVKQRTAELAASTAMLQENQKDLKRAQEVGQIGSWRLDIRRNVLNWSDENHRIFGVPSGTALTYETFLGIVHPDDRRYVDTQWNAGLRGQPYDIEHRIVVNGQVKWVREKAYLERDDTGALLGGFGITQDITERKEAEEKFHQAKATSEALNRIHEALHATLDFQEVMQRIVDIGSTFLRSESAAVSLRQADHWIVSHVYALPSGFVGKRMEDDQELHAVFALKSRRPVAVDDAFNDDRFNREHLRRHKIRSVLVAPLISRGEELGVIFFNYHSARHDFTESEVNFVHQMANIAAAALANARLFEARRLAEDKVRRINRELEQRVKDRTAEIEAQYKELEELNEIIRKLSRKTIEAMENDRKALAKEIHDSIAGTLAAIKLQLEGRMSRMSPSAQGLSSDLMPIEKIVEYLAQAIKETRNISMQLRSLTLDGLGLKPALVEHIQHFKQFYPGIAIDSQIEIAGDIPDDIQTVIYRVVQEALNNVGKHSAATVVRVKLTNLQNQIWLEVADNGCGFDVQRVLSDTGSLMGYGIHSMRERIEICEGKFQIRSNPQKGTAINVSIPI